MLLTGLEAGQNVSIYRNKCLYVETFAGKFLHIETSEFLYVETSAVELGARMFLYIETFLRLVGLDDSIG